jgi:hypothetical protein
MKHFLRIVGNERCSSPLLSYEADVVRQVHDLVSAQKSKLQQLKTRMTTLSDIERRFSHAMELEVLRWNYVLRIYHAARFKKIQALLGKLILPVVGQLSDFERTFSENLVRAIKAAMPGECEFTPDSEDQSAFVFFQAIEDLGPTLLSASSTSEAVPLQHNQIYFARLEHIRHLLDAGRVFLV